MARKKSVVEEASTAAAAADAGSEEVVPTFTLRADQRGHLRALIAAAGELGEADMRDALGVIREFELYEEAQR
jgi:hypothetical protein